tara:strand:- start:68 stop:517 length:450 start_codon:yes stop_codon:yes gene_type:complete
MIADPHKYIKEYINSGSDTVIIHYEASKDIKKDLTTIRDLDTVAGIAINPDTKPDKLVPYLDYIDYILIMSVFPGFGGQSFIESTLQTMQYLNELRKNREIILAVDGGVNLSTIDKVYNTGVDITIVGSGLYGATNIDKRYKMLMDNDK